MDIFGFYEQTLQGADILANSDDHNKYKVFIPDWFEGKPADISWYASISCLSAKSDVAGIRYPPKTEEQGNKLNNFFSTIASPPKIVGKVPDTVKEIEKQHPEIKSWGIIGVCFLHPPGLPGLTDPLRQFCWGGKITALSTKTDSGNPFKVAAVCHPAMVDPEDAKAIEIPFCMLASGDENADEVKQFENNLKSPDKYSEVFGDQVHGWMAARADLKDSKVKAEYERGYKTVVEWFGKYMK